MQTSNAGIAKLLREIAAAYQIKKLGNIFQIRAYEIAADAIEHSTSEVRDLWEEGKLDQVPGLGEKLKEYLDELFKKGKVKHFEDVKKGIPKVVFDMLDVSGIGPQTAIKLSELGVKDIDDLKRKIKNGQLVKKGFSAKIAEKIMDGIREVENRSKGRIFLPYASAQAAKVVEYLKKSPDVIVAHALGSLRRMVVTVGDLDFAASSKNPEKVVDYFINMPGVARVMGHGDNKATVVLHSGLQLDLLVGDPDSYGALLQHFTGSKQHNIHLRTLAEKKGLSLSEYGVRKIKNQKSNLKSAVKNSKLVKTETEEEFYRLLDMDTPPPEIREDTGEIEAAFKHKLPNLIELKDIKGDLHLHSNYTIESPSHGPGADSIEIMVTKAGDLDYEYVGISDHPPGFSSTSKEKIIEWVQKRTKLIQKIIKSKKSIRVLNGLEVDILGDGSLSVPDEGLAMLDYCIAGIHSGHRGSKEQITKRLMKALENPYVDAISHPTNRLINERESSEADWETVFKFCAKNKKLLEINGFYNRLDLRDDLVRQALGYGVKFVINTDAHAVEQMLNMPFGVAVARRGWVTKKDVVNTWNWVEFAKWFGLG